LLSKRPSLELSLFVPELEVTVSAWVWSMATMPSPSPYQDVEMTWVTILTFCLLMTPATLRVRSLRI
jgi:hypothetical protein